MPSGNVGKASHETRQDPTARPAAIGNKESFTHEAKQRSGHFSRHSDYDDTLSESDFDAEPDEHSTSMIEMEAQVQKRSTTGQGNAADRHQ